MSKMMRFANIMNEYTKKVFVPKTPEQTAIYRMLITLCAQEAIRESVPVREPDDARPMTDAEVAVMHDALRKSAKQTHAPVRSPEPAGPTLAEQIAWLRAECEFRKGHRYEIEATKMFCAVLASLERLARTEDDGK